MTLLQHEIDAIAAHILDKVADRLDGTIRATIRQEMKRMTDQAITDLAAATDAIVAELGSVVSALQKDTDILAAALVNSGATLDPAIAAQTKRLVDGTAAAAAAVAALAAPASAPASGSAPSAAPEAAPGSSPAAAPAPAASATSDPAPAAKA